MQEADALEPGLYLGLEDEVYHNDPAISYSSGIKKLLSSPEEFWEASPVNPSRPAWVDTADMKQGSLMHCLLFEPDCFDDRYFIMPGGRWDDSKIMVGRADYLAAVKCVQVIRALPDYNKMLHHKFGYPEVVIVWDDPATGVRCRSKHDFLCWEWSVDYKSVETVNDDFLRYTFKKHQYRLQAKHYTNGRREIRKAVLEGKADFYGDFSDEFKKEFLEAENDYFVFLCQSRKSPHTARPLYPSDSMMARAEEEVARALALYQHYYAKYGLSADVRWESAPYTLQEIDDYYGVIDQ